ALPRAGLPGVDQVVTQQVAFGPVVGLARQPQAFQPALHGRVGFRGALRGPGHVPHLSGGASDARWGVPAARVTTEGTLLAVVLRSPGPPAGQAKRRDSRSVR